MTGPIYVGMPDVERLVQAAAACDTNVLLLGDSGTGKEVIARDIHRRSRRAQRAFMAFNCGAIPEELAERELFGNERGAFTGADQRRGGLFEAADGGTLFLDEVGELSPRMQVKFLRVLEERQFLRVGGTSTISSNFRLIAATNRRLDGSGKHLRSDLYWRLNVLPVTLPSVRDRPGARGALLDHFLDEFSTTFARSPPALSTEARQFLVDDYPYPGEIRELRNIVERIFALGLAPPIGLDDIRARLEPVARGSDAYANTPAPVAAIPEDLLTGLESLPGYCELSERSRNAVLALVTAWHERLPNLGDLDRWRVARKEIVPKGLSLPQEFYPGALVAYAVAAIIRWEMSVHFEDRSLSGAFLAAQFHTGFRNPGGFIQAVLALLAE